MLYVTTVLVYYVNCLERDTRHPQFKFTTPCYRYAVVNYVRTRAGTRNIYTCIRFAYDEYIITVTHYSYFQSTASWKNTETIFIPPQRNTHNGRFFLSSFSFYARAVFTFRSKHSRHHSRPSPTPCPTITTVHPRRKIERH